MNARFLSRLRLMPVVIAVGAGLVMLKTSGLVLEAQAEETAAAQAAAPAKPKADLAGPEEQNASPHEVDILSALAKRRGELDGRTRDLDMRANLLSATEKRVDDKIAQLKDLQAQITKLLNARDEEQKKQVASLVKTYSSMKAKAAADIFAALDEDVLIPVAQDMKSDVLAPILAAMPPAAAQRLTVKLANRLMLPKAPPAPPAGLVPDASQPIQESQIEPALPAQRQAAITPATEAAKPVQVAAKEPAKVEAKPAAAPIAKPAAPAAAPAQVAAKPPVAAPAKPEITAAVPAQSATAKPATAAPQVATPTATAAPAATPAPAAPTAPAAPPAATIH